MAVLSSPLQLIAAVPIFTRIFTSATFGLSAFYLWLLWTGQDKSAAPFLTLIPGSSVFYPWTFLTSVLVETTFVELAVSLLWIPASLRYLERLWGAIEVLKFVVFTVVISNIIAVGLNWVEFTVTSNADLFLYGMQYHGQMALQIGVLVAFTQLIPEHQVQVMGVIKARVKTLPMVYLTISTVLCLLGYQCPYVVIQFGWLVSWVYLRFYKKNTEQTVDGGHTYGDRSETFALVQWFPPAVRYPISILADSVYAVANRLHLIPSAAPDEGTYTALPGPSNTRAEAERRRAMALKALDQRLANTAPTNAGSPAQPAAAATADESAVSKPQEDA